MTSFDWPDLAWRLGAALHLQSPPIGIAFGETKPTSIPSFDEPMSEPTEDGRRGRVPAGCVFWVKATERVFVTDPEDHGNCSVGRVIHGLATPDEVGHNNDVKTLLDARWVGADDVAGLPTLSVRPEAITYGPLADLPEEVRPDVVLVRVNGRQMMVISDAIPEVSISGKPQCQIVAIREGTTASGCERRLRAFARPHRDVPR